MGEKTKEKGDNEGRGKVIREKIVKNNRKGLKNTDKTGIVACANWATDLHRECIYGETSHTFFTSLD